MIQSFKVYPYKQGSKSAKLLATILGGKVLKREGSSYNPKEGHVIINWGSSHVPSFGPATVLNKDVTVAHNKLTSFVKLKEGGVNVPEFWTDRNSIPSDCYPIVCRSILTGHSGDGITIAANQEALVSCPLYVKYIKKVSEYRVHVYNGNAFFIQRKAKKSGVTNPNWQVRNLEGGFAFVECDSSSVPPQVLEQSIMACQALGLDFGGVDVIWNANMSKAFVLEVNTACGLEERTANKYADVFKNSS
jgi:glutathione synthase/RimK-type ligase-like ATP-grasp enzyme